MLSKLDQFIKSGDRIPSIPAHMSHILQTIGKPNVTIKELERLIAPDATLSARILRLSNSAFYYRMAPVTRISDALIRLGFRTTRSLVVTVWTHSIKLFMQDQDDIAIMTAMLNHGTASAVIAKSLLERINRKLAEDAFLAALLHDMGRLAFTCQYGKRYKEDILVCAENNATEVALVEERVLGFNHAVLGRRLLEAWRLGAINSTVAGNHHAASIIPAKDPLLAAVALADIWATELGHNIALNAFRPKRDDLVEFFRLEDIAAFKIECEAKIVSMIEALSG